MILKITNSFMFLLMVTINFLANLLPINNKTTGELSAQYPNLFVPAGITFSIWGILYLLMSFFTVFQFRTDYRPIVKRIGLFFAGSCLLNSLWIFAWHYERLNLSIVVMTGLLIMLVIINKNVAGSRLRLPKAVFGLYLGWICIATIANITAVLVFSNWTGWGLTEVSWTVIMIFAGLIITAKTMFTYNNLYIGLAASWAFSGIIIKQYPGNTTVFSTALVAMLIILAFTTRVLVSKKLKR